MKKVHSFIILCFVFLFSNGLSANRLYWADGNWGGTNYIKSCNLDGSDVNTVIQLNTGFYGAMDVDIHQADSQIYWICPWGTIERCNIDGSGYKRIVSISNAWTDDIFVNETNSRIYFTDTNIRDVLCSVDLNGLNYADIINEFIICFDIDPVHNKIYYVTLYEYMPPYNNQAGRIWQSNLDGSGKIIIFQYNSNEWPEQVAINATEQKIYWYTIRGRFQRANFDGSNPEVIFTTTDFYCSGLVIDETNEKMYWVNYTSKKIQRANLDGTGVEDILTGLGSDPYGIDILIENEKYCGGSGTAGNPYLICTAEQMNQIGLHPEDWGKHFKLTADIDLGYYDGIEGRPKFNCIGTRTPYGYTPFTGVFDGNNKTIYNFTYITYKGNGVGIFVSFGGPEAEIRDLTIDSPLLNVVGHVYYAALVARSESGTIRNCHVVGGNISCDDYVGALVGDNWADIYCCSATASVSGYEHVGGLVGRNQGRIYKSFTSGSVSGTTLVGGIAGRNSNAFSSYGLIENSYSTSDVTGQYAGGLVGQQWGGSVVNSYSISKISGSNYVGGLIGNIVVGGYAVNSFWDTSTSLIKISAGGTGLPTEQMQDIDTFLNAGWDFSTPIWTIWDGGDYPRLAWENSLSGDFGLDALWMYQNLPGQSGSNLTATVLISDDPLGNTSYSFHWEFILPDDVTTAPSTVAGGGSNDGFWTFAASGCSQSGGISDSGQAIKVRVTITGNDYGNTGIAEAAFGIALLGDVNNDGVVNVADRSIANAFWRTGSAGGYDLRDCDVNCDGVVNVADRSITNAVWKGTLGQNSVSSPCSLR